MADWMDETCRYLKENKMLLEEDYYKNIFIDHKMNNF